MITNLLAIIERANELGINFHNDNLSLIMDIDCANDNIKLDTDKLIHFDDYNFDHDISGMQRNINRETKKIDNCFVPRCARH